MQTSLGDVFIDMYKTRLAINSRWVSYTLLLVLYWIAATASMSGFIGKWALRDSAPTYGIEQVFDNTAIKPFAYRILLPTVANVVDRIVPANVKAYAVDKLGPYRTFTRATSSVKPSYAFRYIVVMHLCLGLCLASLFVLREVLLELKFSMQTATSIPVIFVLAFPFIQTIGGYFYDYAEMFFFSAAVLLALRNQLLLLCLMAIPATLNKEAFFFFLPTLYPFLRARSSKKAAILILAGAVGISGLVNAIVKWVYLDAGGGAAHFQFFDNLHKYLLPTTYAQLEVTYGFVGPSGAFIGTLFVIVAVILRGWPTSPAKVRAHLLIAAIVNFPLFLLFCAPGEMRNLSLLFVGFVVLIASTVEQPLDRGLAMDQAEEGDKKPLSTADV
ncbi:hypothetical protein ACL58G_03835 [Massilia sp. GER05]|uniref:hypothetical protein n=1 Tax=unclassified Massilia TaxID=2609279 RepID=UPI0039A4FC35